MRVRSCLWTCFSDECDPGVRRRICHAIAKASEGWTELLPNLVNTLVRWVPFEPTI
jgi:hypothetical protein